MSGRIDAPDPSREHPAGESLELEPLPDIQNLFQQYNKRFFRGRLSRVEVQWSNRMTSAAGSCLYDDTDRSCRIRVSRPLLSLRPRKDLVETLLHEMIHAFLYVCKKDYNTCQGGHGPRFLRYMEYINRRAGTCIKVSHSFDDEVLALLRHWFLCSRCGRWLPCAATRRHKRCPPWPNDKNWRQHRAQCGGRIRKTPRPLWRNTSSN